MTHLTPYVLASPVIAGSGFEQMPLELIFISLLAVSYQRLSTACAEQTSSPRNKQFRRASFCALLCSLDHQQFSYSQAYTSLKQPRSRGSEWPYNMQYAHTTRHVHGIPSDIHHFDSCIWNQLRRGANIDREICACSCEIHFITTHGVTLL